MCDNSKVDAYLESKGFQKRSDESSLSAMKRHLAEDNAGIILSVVEDAEHIEILELSVPDVIIPNPMHYDRVESREPVSAYAALSIAGVLAGGRLVDGYHRMKWLKENGVESAPFIELS